MAKKLSPNLVPFFLFIILLTIAFIPSVRNLFAKGMDICLGELIDTLNIPFYIVILFLATCSAFFTALIQKHTIDHVIVDHNKEKTKDFQKKYWEVMRTKDQNELKEMEILQKKMAKEQLEVTLVQLRPMGYILFVTLPVFFWLIYRASCTNAQITLPFFGTVGLKDAIIGPFSTWIVWYLICSFSVSYVIRNGLNVR